jgi:hypothetical protein
MREYQVGVKGAVIVNDCLFFSTIDLHIRRISLRSMVLRWNAGDSCTGYEGDRIYSDMAVDFYVSPYDEAVYLLRPNGDVIRLNANHHIALSNIVQVTDWMSITKMGSSFVVGGWNGQRRENHIILLTEKLQYQDRLDISCSLLSRPL